MSVFVNFILHISWLLDLPQFLLLYFFLFIYLFMSFYFGMRLCICIIHLCMNLFLSLFFSLSILCCHLSNSNLLASCVFSFSHFLIFLYIFRAISSSLWHTPFLSLFVSLCLTLFLSLNILLLLSYSSSFWSFHYPSSFVFIFSIYPPLSISFYSDLLSISLSFLFAFFAAFSSHSSLSLYSSVSLFLCWVSCF